MLRFPGRFFFAGPWQAVFDEICDLRGQMDRVESKVDNVAKSVSDLDQSVANLEAQEAAAATAQLAAIAEIQGAVDSILQKVPPAIDLSAEVGRVDAVIAFLQGQSGKLQAAADTVAGEALGPPPPQP